MAYRVKLPFLFRHILNYLRDSYIGLESFGKEDLHFLEELSHEAQFFNIAGLCSDISRRWGMEVTFKREICFLRERARKYVFLSQ